GIEVRLASEADLRAWQSFVDRTADAGALHHAGWHGVLHDAYDVTPLFWTAVGGDGTILGVLPGYASRSRLAGSHVSSLEGGIVAHTAEAGQALLEQAIIARDRSGARYLQIRGGPVSETSVHNAITVRTIVPTARPSDELWATLKQSCRRALRKG